MDYTADHTSVGEAVLMLYMISAFFGSCALILFAVAGIVLALLGQYSWKAVLFLCTLILLGVFFWLTDNLALVIAMIACSPMIGVAVVLIDRVHRKKTKTNSL